LGRCLNEDQYLTRQLSAPMANWYVAASPLQQITTQILRRRNFVP
jgi:hypothetical protein